MSSALVKGISSFPSDQVRASPSSSVQVPGEGRHYFSMKSRMNRSRRRVGLPGPSRFHDRPPSRTKRVQKSARGLMQAPCLRNARCSRDSGDRRLEKRLFKETRMNTISALLHLPLSLRRQSAFHRAEKRAGLNFPKGVAPRPLLVLARTRQHLAQPCVQHTFRRITWRVSLSEILRSSSGEKNVQYVLVKGQKRAYHTFNNHYIINMKIL